MGRGRGPVQRFILEELKRRFDPEKPTAWVHQADLAEGLAAERGEPVTEAVRTSVFRAIHSLWDRGDVEVPAYDRTSGRETYYDRHAGQMRETWVGRFRKEGLRCRLPLSEEERQKIEAQIATMERMYPL